MGIEIYVNYRFLVVSDLATLFDVTDQLYSWSYALSSDRAVARFPAHPQMRRFLAEHLNDALSIDSVHTGDSITIRGRSGWVPSLTFDEGDVTVDLPKGFAAVITMGAMLLGGFTGFNISVKSYYERLKAAGEIQLQEKQRRKLDLEIEQLDRKLHQLPEGVRHGLGEQQRQLQEMVRHGIVTSFRVRAFSIADAVEPVRITDATSIPKPTGSRMIDI